MSEGRLLKPDKDFTQEVDKQIPEAQETAKVSAMVYSQLIPDFDTDFDLE